MVNCWECGVEVEEESKHLHLCLKCGKKVDEERLVFFKQESVCVICGESCRSGDYYCLNCGPSLPLVKRTGRVRGSSASRSTRVRTRSSVCTVCGAPYEMRHTYCMNCGNKLSKGNLAEKTIYKGTPQRPLSFIRKKRYGFTIMIIALVLIILLLPPFLNTFHQYLTGMDKTQWYKSYGGIEDDGALSLLQTSDGGYALSGYTQSFGAGRSDIWLIKTDTMGIMQWNRTYGGSGRDIAYSFIQTSDGGFALAGYTNSSGAGSADMWLVKTNSNGIEQWNQTYGGSRWDSCLSLLQTSDGGYALAGATNSTSGGSADMWLVKTDATGSQEWNYTYGGTEIDGANVLLQTLDGGFALVGSSNSSGSGEHDIWLVKTDANGVAQWNRTYQGNGLFGVSALYTANGEYILLYHNRSEFSFFDYSLLLIKTDINGEIQWSQTFEELISVPLHFGYFKPLIQTEDRGFALAGLKFSEEGDSISTSLVKTDLNGEILWTKPYKEMIVEDEEGEVCMVSSLLQISNGDYIMAGVVLTLSEYAGGIIDTDVWIGFVIQNIDQISGWEGYPFLIVICVLSKKFKKGNILKKNQVCRERRN